MLDLGLGTRLVACNLMHYDIMSNRPILSLLVSQPVLLGSQCNFGTLCSSYTSFKIHSSTFAALARKLLSIQRPETLPWRYHTLAGFNCTVILHPFITPVRTQLRHVQPESQLRVQFDPRPLLCASSRTPAHHHVHVTC